MHSPRSPVIPISPVGNPKKSLFTSRDPAPPVACKVMETISENIKTIGQQFAMTKPAPCGSGGSSGSPCTFTVGIEKSFQTALSSESSFSLTTSEAIEESIEADAAFLRTGVKSTTNPPFSMSQEWTTTTGKEVTNGIANTKDTTLVQEPGTTAFLSFVPFYRCWYGEVKFTTDNGN